VLLTRPPLPRAPKSTRAFDLHVLGTPPAFILSQDQTRHPWCIAPPHVGVGSALRCIELRSRPSCQICTWLFADSLVFSLCCQRQNFIDRNCGVRVRVHPVAVLLSTLQLSRYLNERLFRSFASTQVLLHSSDTLSRA
jgi:hypothetical protein